MKNKVKFLAASLVILASGSFAQTVIPNEIKMTTPISKNEGKYPVTAEPITGNGHAVLANSVTKGDVVAVPDVQSQSRSAFAKFHHNHPMLGKLLMQNNSKLSHSAVNPKAFVKRQVVIRNHMQVMRGK
jgi:hypothetical protein